MPPKAVPGNRWSSEADIRMLVLALTVTDFKPSATIWKAVADQMGNGLTANAVQ